MRSNYKRLGQFIEQVKARNSGAACQDLRGVSIDKEFMPSVANVTDTDLSVYKLVIRDQFAFNPMHVGRDEVLPIAHHTQEKPIIVSPAYVVFEITKPEELLPEYLMMWCRRPEFDRLAWFTTDSSVRGGFAWEDFCSMELPVPSPEKQREIVAEYRTVVDRIRLNERLNEKLEETAQAVYRHWFVDFEFPMTADQALALGKPELEGKPYKSSGGELAFNEVLDQEIPAGWATLAMNDVIDEFLSNRGKSKALMRLGTKTVARSYPVISAMNVNSGKLVKLETVPYVDKSDFDSWMPTKLEHGDLLMTSEAPLGEVYFVCQRHDLVLSQRLFGLKADKAKTTGSFLYFWLRSRTFKIELEGRSSGTAAVGIRLSELKKAAVLSPAKPVVAVFDGIVSPLLRMSDWSNEQNNKLNELVAILYSKLAQQIV